MPTVDEIMAELEANGSESIKKILVKHGVKEPFFGVKIEYLKTITKKVKLDNELAKGLYVTGNADAQYLAGLITDDKLMSKAELQDWVKAALSDNINGFTVPWVAAGSNFGYELGVEWIDSEKEYIAAAGWSTLSNLVALKTDSEIDIAAFEALLDRVANTIHASPNRVRRLMNNFIIAVGTYVAPLTDKAIAAANQIGDVIIDMNGTACKVPGAVEYIEKSEKRGVIGKRRKL